MSILQLQRTDTAQLQAVTKMCMQTVLETIPEFGGDTTKAQVVLPNFTFEQMFAMIQADCDKPSHRICVGLDDNQNIQSYMLLSLRHNPQGQRYGYIFSMGVVAEIRRSGSGTQLLYAAEQWFRAEECIYIQAETHVTNLGLQALFQRKGFTATHQDGGPWPSYRLVKPLS